jgi:aspartyl/glutamyl-tRNA(Asn/Gln) amidotransferase C subunit
MNREILKKLEKLNQIKLDDMQEDSVLSFFAKREAESILLDTIDTAKIEPMVHVIHNSIALREDVIVQDFSRQDLQTQAPDTDVGYFCVPRVIE